MMSHAQSFYYLAMVLDLSMSIELQLEHTRPILFTFTPMTGHTRLHSVLSRPSLASTTLRGIHHDTIRTYLFTS